MVSNLLLKMSLSVAIVGIAFLLGVMALPSYEEIDAGSLESMPENSKVMVKGMVKTERDFGDFTVLDVEGVDVVCDCPSENVFAGKEVLVRGLVSTFNDRNQVSALRISEVPGIGS